MEAVVKRLKEDKYLLLLFVPVIVYYVIFHYVPMYGAIIAFKNFRPALGILDSKWAGFDYFSQFFNSIYFWRLIRNTVLLNVYSLVWGFPAPIIFALLLNEFRDRWFKRLAQTISYLPHFISIVVIVGMISMFTSIYGGIVNKFIGLFGIDPINFLGDPAYFRTIFVSSGIWQGFGWGSIIYLAALAGINPHLYEAASIDGANRWKKMIYITLPGLMPTIIILLILNIGNLMDVGFEKVWLLSSPATYETSDIIATFVYRRGVTGAEYSYGAAVNLFNNVINLILLVTFNYISRKVSDTSLW